MSEGQGTFLPPTSSSLAKAMDLVEARLLALPVDLLTKDPGRVHVGLLDHLAWETSVDVWDPSWPEAVKRRVIAASAEVHRYKGTPYAIKAVLASLDLDGGVIEWWQDGGSGIPGTFAVQADIARSGEILPAFGPKMLRLLVDLVRGAAPMSRFFEVNLHYAQQAGLPLACVVSMGARLSVHPQIDTSLSETAEVPMALIIAANARLEIDGAG
ncbi:phage tail protein I [Pararhodobacter sp. CCB-MM2]|uniref:phage tail protein I n=1 Tax=Pararhodobacter sp. CCB-MM2 TaxID=1786003 RepID=UPI000829A16A|nr:phage tail protein I [Pararhodobacter sp. CCB-MM2]